MSKQTETNFFMFPPKALKYVGFYQELLKGIVDYDGLGNRLVILSEQARAFRRFDELSEYALILSKFQLKTYQSIGQYYLALSLCRNGRGELDKARTILEKVVSDAPLKYRAEAMVTLSSVCWDLGQPDETLRYRLEASRISGFSETAIKALRGIAVVKSFEGFHKSALRDLENMYQIVKYAPPHIYFDYLNSLAIELAECSRLYEARNVSRIACSSPLISVYPEWRETARELKEPDRSFISISESLPKFEHKHVEIETKPAPKSEKDMQSANVLPFQKLKEAPEPEQPESVSPTDWDDMTASEKKDLLMTALRTDAISERHYDGIVFQTGMLKTEPVSNVIDLEDNLLLDRLILHWVNMIEPEEFVGVLSALRDCDDRIRQANLIDRMIRKAFQQSQAGYLSEEEWRLKHERRLPKK